MTTTAPSAPETDGWRPGAPGRPRGGGPRPPPPSRRPPDRLAGLQHAEGWWKGELETNVTMDAEDLLLRQFLGIRTDERDRRDGPLDPLPPAGRRHLGQLLRRPARALDHRRGLRRPPAGRRRPRIRRTCAGPPSTSGQAGGVEATRVFTRIWLALFGLWSWDELPVLPPELVLLPPWVPLNIYDFGCWARQTVVALTVVGAHRPVRPSRSTIDELAVARPGPPSPRRR